MFDSEVPGLPVSGGLGLPRFGPDLLKVLSGILQGPSRAEQLRERLLELELSAALVGAATVYALTDLESVAGARRDWVIAGERGSGKTAAAVAIGQSMSRQLGFRLLLADAPAAVAQAIGASSMPLGHCLAQRQAVVVVDEFRLRPKEREALWSSLALGRQHGRAVLATSQSLASVDRDVFRLAPAILWKSSDPLAAAFERPELQSYAAQAARILVQLGRPSGAAAWCDGRWLGLSFGLPAGWSEDISRLWA
jgi:hypothetical protein